jgi:hypothetical protein
MQGTPTNTPTIINADTKSTLIEILEPYLRDDEDDYLMEYLESCSIIS